jgi:hypothetical protein
VELYPGNQIVDPNRFVMLALDRAQMVRDTPVSSRAQQERAQEAIMRIAEDIEAITAWYFWNYPEMFDSLENN